jgi:hypothetical protein
MLITTDKIPPKTAAITAIITHPTIVNPACLE